MKIGPSVERESSRNERTRFERIQLKDGQLSVVRPLPEDFPADFVDQLIAIEPWYKRGTPIGSGGRARLFHIAEVPIVKKRSRSSGEQVKGRSREAVSYYTPSAQMALVDTAKQRYRERYGKELPLEEPVAFFIDRETTEKYTFYRYYPEIMPDEITDQEVWKRIHTRRKRLIKEVRDIGVTAGDLNVNYILTRDPQAEDGIGIVLIDTEFWTVSDQVPPPQQTPAFV